MQVRLRRSALACVLFVMTAVSGVTVAAAQQLPEAPVAFLTAGETKTLSSAESAMNSASLTMIAPVEKARVHRFFDRTGLLSSGVLAAALLTDGAITQSKLGQTETAYHYEHGVQVPYQVKIVEADPIGKIFVNHGWPGTIAGGGLTLGADLGVRYWLHRTNHHRLERVVPFAIAASNAIAAWHDTRY